MPITYFKHVCCLLVVTHACIMKSLSWIIYVIKVVTLMSPTPENVSRPTVMTAHKVCLTYSLVTTNAVFNGY